MSSSPAFGQADMTNCEREQIQFAGSVQPHGLLLVLQQPRLRIVQASRSAGPWLGRPLDWLLLCDLHQLEGDIGPQLQALVDENDLREPHPVRCRVGATLLEGAVHRVADDMLVLELEPVDPPPPAAPSVQIDGAVLLGRLGGLVQRISQASSIGALTDGVVQDLRDMVGYDRVMVYRRGWNRCSAIATRPPTYRSARASCTCATACACWSTCITKPRCWYRSGSAARPRVRMASWTCRCATCAACRRCTCST